MVNNRFITPEQLAASGSEDGEQFEVFSITYKNGEADRHTARLLKHTRYKSDKPCAKCGEFIRLVSSKKCIVCHREKQNNIGKSEKGKLRKRELWEVNSNKHSLKRKQRLKDKPDEVRAVNKRWCDANPDKVLNYRIKHKNTHLRATKEWKKNNPEKAREIRIAGENNRRARVKNVGGKISAKRIRDLLIEQNNCCYWCLEVFVKPYEIEHIIPLSKGGDNSEENIALACKLCNAQKNNKLPEEWFKYPLCRNRRIS